MHTDIIAVVLSIACLAVSVMLVEWQNRRRQKRLQLAKFYEDVLREIVSDSGRSDPVELSRRAIEAGKLFSSTE